jgi:potassium uptake TrkH family protein
VSVEDTTPRRRALPQLARTGDAGRRALLVLQQPARLIPVSFAAVILLGAGLLMLPAATTGPGGASFSTAFFTSTSATCVTGLAVVDTGTYWSVAGQAVILGLVQVGGLGIVTLTTLGVLILGRRMGLRRRFAAQAGTSAMDLVSVRRVIAAVAIFTLLFEATFTVILALRFWAVDAMSVGSAVWHGLFHTVSAFNNAGFGLRADNLVRYAQDPVVSLGIAALLISGGLGFPLWLELYERSRGRRRRLSLNTRLVLSGSAFLIAAGVAAVLLFEWSNPSTLGAFRPGERLLPAFFQGVTPRTAGFNTLDYSAMREETWLTQMMLMFVGGGPASTAGGIKVTSFLVLVLFMVSEARGVPDTNAFGRRVPVEAVRQAFVVSFIALNAVVLGTLLIMAETDFPFVRVLFEAVSAFATVGLSTGITPELNDVSRYVLDALMFLGRTGPYTLAVALALRQRPAAIRYAEERPIIG